jgi:hypothetical protein
MTTTTSTLESKIDAIYWEQRREELRIKYSFHVSNRRNGNNSGGRLTALEEQIIKVLRPYRAANNTRN